MIDSSVLVIFLTLIVAALAAVILRLRFVHKRELAESVKDHDLHAAKFRENFLKSLSVVLPGKTMGEILPAIAEAVSQAFESDAFIFERTDETANLLSYTSKKSGDIASLASRAGIKFDAHKIPLSRERVRLFEAGFRGYDELFPLIDDLVTSAASRKIQRELKVEEVASVSAKADSGTCVILLLLPAKIPGMKEELEQFASLLATAFSIVDLKTKVKEFEEKFDEQFIAARNELRARESAHLSVFSEMTLPAALIDKHGLIIESNEALGKLFAAGMNPVGQPLFSVMDEEHRRGFASLLMNLPTEASSETAVKISGKSYKVHIVPSKFEGDGRLNIAVYFFDETPILNVKEELGRTIDSLRAEKESAEKQAAEERTHLDEVIRNSEVPLLEVVDDKTAVASKSLRELFTIKDGESLNEFVTGNGLTDFESGGNGFEATDRNGRSFIVEKWISPPGTFYSFTQTTDLKAARAEATRLASESDELFNGPLPTAFVKGNELVKTNPAFETVFAEALSSDRTLEGLLKYLGESPGPFLAELQSGAVASRTCRTKDGRYLNLNVVDAHDLILLYAEDITDEENVRQELRRTQNLLSDSLESFSGEPFFIVEGGIVSAANSAAREKLNIKLDQPFEGGTILASYGFSAKDGTLELDGVVHKVNVASSGNSIVYRFEEVTRDIQQRSEIDRLARRQDILKELSSSDHYESILQNLAEIIRIDGIDVVKIISTGTILEAKATAEILLQTFPSEKIEPSRTLSLSPEDIAVIDRGEASREELPNTTFMSVVSGDYSKLMISSSAAGDSRGFASIALQEGEIRKEMVEELSHVLKVASSVAIGISTRVSAERKFESSDKVTRALVGLTGIGDEGFEDAARKSVDLLRQIFAPDSVGIYRAEGPVLEKVAMNGSLPDNLSLPDLKFGALVSSGQLETGELTGSEGLYYAVKSRKKDLVMIYKFIGIPPAPSELSAIGSISLDLLESRRGSEHQTKVAGQLLDESKQIIEFMTGLTGAASSQDILAALRLVLERKFGADNISVGTQDTPDDSLKPMELREEKAGESTLYRINLLNFGSGIVTVKCPGNAFSRNVVRLAIDELKSSLVTKLPVLQREAELMRGELDKAKSDLASMRDSVDKVPSSMRSARIKIDNALSRLPFIQGEDRLLQEIRLQLAAAVKDISQDVDTSTKNQDDIFEDVRATITGREGSKAKFKKIDISVLTDFKAPGTSFDLIKDLIVNFLMVADVRESEVILMTAQPSPGEAASGKGKHVSVRLIAPEDDMVHDDPIRNNVSIQTLIANVEKMGYEVDTRALGNELTLDICEVRSVEGSSQQTIRALLVEDDQVLAHEESQKLIEVFTLLKVASDAVEAAMIIESAKFDIAFVDLTLPAVNGRELCQQIKKEQPACITVLLTNREGEERSEGVDRILERPLDTRVLSSLTRK